MIAPRRSHAMLFWIVMIGGLAVMVLVYRWLMK
jgi:hypothetical protein